MDAGSFKTLVTSHGLVYQYFWHQPPVHIPGQPSQEGPPLPILLFVHGFPTNSRIWRNQITFFIDKGFSVLAPDLLGFGGSAKPQEPNAYVMSLICQDLVDILKHEDVKGKVVAIGHDM